MYMYTKLKHPCERIGKIGAPVTDCICIIIFAIIHNIHVQLLSMVHTNQFICLGKNAMLLTTSEASDEQSSSENRHAHHL